MTEPASADPAASPGAVVQIDASGVVWYPIYNLHGDPIGAADATGTLTAPQAEYSAFGSPTATALPQAFDGYLPSSNGFDYADARYYYPASGRFLSPDPVSAINPYIYGGDNPIGNPDPTGQGFKDTCKSILAAGGIIVVLAGGNPGADELIKATSELVCQVAEALKKREETAIAVKEAEEATAEAEFVIDG